MLEYVIISFTNQLNSRGLDIEICNYTQLLSFGPVLISVILPSKLVADYISSLVLIVRYTIHQSGRLAIILSFRSIPLLFGDYIHYQDSCHNKGIILYFIPKAIHDANFSVHVIICYFLHFIVAFLYIIEKNIYGNYLEKMLAQDKYMHWNTIDQIHSNKGVWEYTWMSFTSDISSDSYIFFNA